jgi:hypothetical protein
MGKQFSPAYTKVHITTNTTTNSTEWLGENATDTGGNVIESLGSGESYTDITNQRTTRNTTEELAGFGSEVWWGGNWTDNQGGT